MARLLNIALNRRASVLLLTLLFFLPLQIFSQSKEVEDEILVYFMPDSLDLPEGTNELTDVHKLKIKSKNLERAFKKIELKSINKAFPEFSMNDTLKLRDDGSKVKLPNMSRIFKLKLKKKDDVQAVIDILSEEKGVLFAEPNGITAPDVVPNDQYFSSQWSLQSGGGTGKIQAPEAWSFYTGTSSNLIGIVDGGVDGTHPDLNGKVSGDSGYGWSGHGIHVAGIAAAKTNNWNGSVYVGIAGVDWHAQLHAQRVDNTDDAGTYQAVVDAVNYSSNVRVLNNSWSLINYDYSPRYSTTVKLAFSYAYKMNRVVVCSNGNYQVEYPNQTYYPAGFGKGIIAVGATNSQDQVASFSQVNNSIDVSAPGVGIYSTYRNPDYQYFNGTSMAAPHVSGLASLLKGFNSTFYNDDIEQIIRLSTDDVNSSTDPGWDQFIGTGRINAHKAFKLITTPNQIVRLGTYTGGTVASTSNAFTARIYGVPGIADGTYSVTRYEVIRDITFPQYMSPPAVPGLSFNLPQVWGNGTATTASVTGLEYYNGNCAACCTAQLDIFGLPHTEVVPGTVTNTGARLRTYVYRLRTLYYISGVCVPNTDLGYYPTSPSNVQFAATVIGRAGIQKSNQLTDVTTSSLFSLDQNYPNPFNPTTVINYNLPQNDFVTLRIYDVLGREVAVLINENKEAGYHSAEFNASHLPSGVYFYKVTAGNFSEIRKMLLLK